VISTDPSQAIHIRGGQVILEGRYQCFVNSTLDFSCSQLKGKTGLCEKMYHFLGNISNLRLNAD